MNKYIQMDNHKSILVYFLAFFIFTSQISAQSVLCVANSIRVKDQKVATKKGLKVVNGTSCPRGFSQVLTTSSFSGAQGATGATGPAGATGLTGATGPAGADGQLRIYGNGSAGALNVTDAFANLDTSNLQFTDCNIANGASLAVPSGTIIRCTGNVNIAGSISINTGALGGQIFSVPTTNVYTASARIAHPGRTRVITANGEMGGSSLALTGASAAFGMGSDEARLAFYPAPFGGSGGGASVGSGGTGGGYFAILAAGSITFSGTGAISQQVISTTSGAGGGGGAIIVLASKTSVTIPSTSTISATGGDGAASTTTSGAGGGGGGGGIYIISPSNTVNTSSLIVSAGAAGDNTTQITEVVAISGGAGGASVGSGGAGGGVSAGRPANALAANPGSDGAFYLIQTDPTALF